MNEIELRLKEIPLEDGVEVLTVFFPANGTFQRCAFNQVEMCNRECVAMNTVFSVTDPDHEIVHCNRGGFNIGKIKQDTEK